ncbi:probable G-protein coupled receptor Mth-like 12 isoform X2 [Drosophila subpulchrella]|nr:probable G-protein coupled receptor Mth-like 12 isoform X2 [Drosophila subpulchrella]
MVMMQLLWILGLLELLDLNLYLVLYATVFFQGAYVVWLSVISYHLWQTFKPLKRDDHRYQYLVYSAIAWITAAGTVGLYMNTYTLYILVFGLGNFT